MFVCVVFRRNRPLRIAKGEGTQLQKLCDKVNISPFYEKSIKRDLIISLRRI